MFVNEHKILNNKQFGFLEKCSTAETQPEVANYVYENIN